MQPSADLILANRAYMDHEAPFGGENRTPVGKSGLLAAVRPVIGSWDGRTGTTWVGAGRGRYDRQWTDARGFEIIPTAQGDLRHRRLFFDEGTWQAHYAAVANSFFWPLLHLVREPLPDHTAYYPAPEVPSPRDWAAYANVNERFAMAALEEAPAPRTCWIHDYQLALVPALLRACAFEGRVGFFLHTTFPDLRVAERYLDVSGRDALRQFVAGILGADLIGLQSPGDVERFKAAAVELCGAELVSGSVRVGGRRVRIDAYPVGIDVEEILEVARDTPRPARLAGIAAGLPLVVGLERSDYTKGIPERLNAVARAYREGERFAYMGIAAPTRASVAAYDRLEGAIETAAAGASAAAAAASLPFVHACEVIDWAEVVALQREADVMFTSSLADGMNLVPLQTAVAQSLRPPARRAVIISGRDAGVASAFAGFEADGLVAVDPLDPDQMVRTLREALAGRPGRVTDRLIDAVRLHDARAWATQFLADLEQTC